MYFKIKLVLSILFMLFACSVFAKPVAFDAKQVQASGLTKQQAKQLLLLTLKHEKYKLYMPGVVVHDDLVDDKGNPPHDGFYDFSVSYDTPKAGATEYIGLFSVSFATGDVWEINTCKQFSFPSLKLIQALIMKQTGKTFTSEASQRRGLGCTDE